MGSRSDPKCLPKRFCCCFKLKWGVLLICAYLIVMGLVQFISIFGVLNLGYNTLLTIGDILCGVFAILSVIAIKKIKMGIPLKILACLWAVMTIMTIVSYYEHITRTKDAIAKVEEVEEKEKEKLEQIVSSYIQLNGETEPATTESTANPNNATEIEKSELEDLANESIKELDEWKQSLSEEQASAIFGLWNLFKIYCSLCVMKLGLKIERKHRKNVFFKLR